MKRGTCISKFLIAGLLFLATTKPIGDSFDDVFIDDTELITRKIHGNLTVTGLFTQGTTIIGNQMSTGVLTIMGDGTGNPSLVVVNNAKIGGTLEVAGGLLSSGNGLTIVGPTSINATGDSTTTLGGAHLFTAGTVPIGTLAIANTFLGIGADGQIVQAEPTALSEVTANPFNINVNSGSGITNIATTSSTQNTGITNIASALTGSTNATTTGSTYIESATGGAGNTGNVYIGTNNGGTGTVGNIFMGAPGQTVRMYGNLTVDGTFTQGTTTMGNETITGLLTVLGGADLNADVPSQTTNINTITSLGAGNTTGTTNIASALAGSNSGAATGDVYIGSALAGGAGSTGSVFIGTNNGGTGTVSPVSIGATGATTTVNGPLSVAQAATLNSAAVTNNATVGGTLGVTGDLAINTNKFKVTAASGNTAIAGTLSVAGDIVANGLGVTNNATILGALGVTGSATVAGGITTSSVDTVPAGALTLGTGNATSVTIGRGGQTTQVNGNLSVSQTTTLNGSGAGLAVTNNATVGGTLGVTGNLAVHTNKFTVAAASGNTTIAGTLGVTGATTLAGSLNATNGTVLLGNNTAQTTIGGSIVSIDATGALNLGINTAPLIQIGGASTTDLAIASQSIFVNGETSIAGTLNVTGPITGQSGILANSVDTPTAGLLIFGAANATSVLISPSTTVGGLLTANGGLGVTGATTLAGLTAGATSLSTLSTSGLATLSSAIVSGTLGITGDLAVNTNKFEVTAASGNTVIAGTLSVTGATTLAGLTTTGNVSINANSPSSVVTNIGTVSVAPGSGTEYSAVNIGSILSGAGLFAQTGLVSIGTIATGSSGDTSGVKIGTNSGTFGTVGGVAIGTNAVQTDGGVMIAGYSTDSIQTSSVFGSDLVITVAGGTSSTVSHPNLQIVGLWEPGTAGTHFLEIDASNQVRKSHIAVSTRKVKRNIQPMSRAESSQIYQLRPVEFEYTWFPEDSGLREYGLIAEELLEDEVLEKAVRYDEEGQAKLIRYRMIFMALLNEFLHHKAEYNALAKEHATIKETVTALQAEQSTMKETIAALQEVVAMIQARS